MLFVSLLGHILRPSTMCLLSPDKLRGMEQHVGNVGRVA